MELTGAIDCPRAEWQPRNKTGNCNYYLYTRMYNFQRCANAVKNVLLSYAVFYINNGTRVDERIFDIENYESRRGNRKSKSYSVNWQM